MHSKKNTSSGSSAPTNLRSKFEEGRKRINAQIEAKEKAIKLKKDEEEEETQKKKDTKASIFFVGVVGIVLLAIFFLSTPNKTKERKTYDSSSTSLSGVNYWKNKPNGNGRDWFNANDTQKKWLCNKMGRLSAKNDSQFYMDFFNSFYITNGSLDPATSSATINEASSLANAASRWQ